jgi:signal transduction histidine kinase
MTVFDVYPQITEEKWEKHWQKIFKHETLNFETFHKRKGGGEFSVEVTYNSINFGELQYCCVVDRDITERKKVELKLKESEQMLQIANATKDKFFSIIAHDLRSPFSGIIGLSELLIENVKEFDIAKSEKHLGFINSSAKNTLILLDNLLNWAKSQTGNIIVKPENIILSKVIQEIIEASNFTAKSKNISLNYSSLDEIEVYADENMLLVILRNLISNAIKFTKPGGEVNVSAISKQNQVKISISDNGVGMNEEKLKDLLNISSNATSPGTANEKGSGLGLVLCKEFVEKLGGNIWVESEEGKGSIFYFTLPYTSEMITENTVKDEVLPPVKVTPIKKLKIVIAEDDETSAMFISITVKKFSSEIISVRTGTEAVDACRNNPDIDLVLMDIQMPEINGYEAIRQIRKFNKGVIIIAQTAFALEGDREKAMTAGCDDYITKPIKKDELLKKIEKLLS